MQQRSMPQFQKGYELVKSGQLGPIRKVHLTWNRNAARGTGEYNIDPSTVDWKAWLGSARPQPFDPYRFREWRWYWDFGGGVMADLMVHYIDIAHWYLDVDHPEKAVTIGNKFTNERWETPDTAQTLLQYPGAQVYFESTFMNARNGAMLEFMGTEATLYLDRGRLEVIPERHRDASQSAMPNSPPSRRCSGCWARVPKAPTFTMSLTAKCSISAIGWNASAAAKLPNPGGSRHQCRIGRAPGQHRAAKGRRNSLENRGPGASVASTRSFIRQEDVTALRCKSVNYCFVSQHFAPIVGASLVGALGRAGIRPGLIQIKF